MLCEIKQPFKDADHARERAAFRNAGHNQMRLMYSPRTWLVAAAATTVVDVGSYTGVDLAMFMDRAGPLAANVTIHTFEPVWGTRAALKRRTRDYAQIMVHPYGLGASKDTMCIRGLGDGVALERITRKRPCLPNNRAFIVDAWTAIRKLPRPVDLLQLNCEGCELPVLTRLLKEKTLTQYIKTIEVQFHRPFVSESDYCMIDSQLRALGYNLEYRYTYVWERWTRLNSQQHLHRELGS